MRVWPSVRWQLPSKQTDASLTQVRILLPAPRFFHQGEVKVSVKKKQQKDFKDVQATASTTKKEKKGGPDKGWFTLGARAHDKFGNLLWN